MDSIGPITPAALATPAVAASRGHRYRTRETRIGGPDSSRPFPLPKETSEFCHRRVLARIHRMTLGRLRKEIEPVTSADFMRFLGRWQHLAPGTQLHGADGLFQVLRQLQGYEISAAAWESNVLPRRVANYDPELLDRLCLSGEVMWGRLSPHPALETEGGRRVRPTRVAPLALFLRDDAKRLLSPASNQLPLLSHPARDVFVALESHGASFFNELVRATGRLASEVEDGLWELVAAGLVTGDGFENVRALIDPKRRRGEGRGRTARPRHAAGRWALLNRDAVATEIDFFAGQLLDRWGVVFRDVLSRETLAPAWRDLLQVYRTNGSARRNPRRPVRQRLRGRAVCAARSTRSATALRRSAKTGETTRDRACGSLELEWNRLARSANGRTDASPTAPAGRSSAGRRILSAQRGARTVAIRRSDRARLRCTREGK